MKHIATCGNAIATFLTLAAMLGCQGVSTGSPPPTGGLSWGSPSLSFGNVTAGGRKKGPKVPAENRNTPNKKKGGPNPPQKFFFSGPPPPGTNWGGENTPTSTFFLS